MENTPFGRQLALDADRDVPGRYRTELSESWNCPIVPHGGLVTAVAARAMAMELDQADHPLRSVTNAFAAQVAAGPVEIDVDVLSELEGRRDGFGAVKARRSPLPMCHSEISACYEHRLDELGCRNPEFHELPLERPSFRVFAHVAD